MVSSNIFYLVLLKRFDLNRIEKKYDSKSLQILINISDSDLVWLMHLMSIKGQKFVLCVDNF